MTEADERARAEAALRATESLFQHAVRAVGAQVYEVDVAAGRITALHGAEQLVGETAPPGTSVRWWFSRVHPDDVERVTGLLDLVVDAGEPGYAVEYRIRHPTRGYLLVSDRGTTVREGDGTPVRIVGVVQDITAQRGTEETLRRLTDNLEGHVRARTAELEQLSDRLRRLAAELSDAEQRERRRLAELIHDHLQQLLVASKMRLGAARARAQDPALSATLDRVTDLLDQSLDAARSLTAELRPPVLYEAGLCAAVRWLAEHVRTRDDLIVELDLDESAEPQQDQLKAFLFESVRELLFNVVKHAGAERALVRLGRSGPHTLHLRVADTGRGFDPAVVDAEHSHQAFGLFSIRERLVALGGQLVIQSAPGQGARMNLYVPLGAHDELARLPELEAESSRGRRTPGAEPTRVARVLIADDHQIVREGIANLLDGYASIRVVGQAADGFEAMRQASELRPDVVVMDVNMPRMNGIEATRLIREALPDVRVIGLSVQGESGTARSMREAGADDFLSKGGDPDVLVAAILRAARSRVAEASAGN